MERKCKAIVLTEISLEILVNLPLFSHVLFSVKISCQRMEENWWNWCAITRSKNIMGCGKLMDSGLVLIIGNKGSKEFHSCRRFREFDRAGRYKREERTKISRFVKVIQDGKVLQYWCECLQLCKSLLFSDSVSATSGSSDWYFRFLFISIWALLLTLLLGQEKVY